MQNRRLTAATAAGLALVALAGCRTSPNVAAYVGDARVTVAELESAIDTRLEDPAIEQFASQGTEAYEQRVLSTLLQDEVHTVAAERYGVEVSPADVRDQLDRLLAGRDQEEAYAGLATQGISRPDAFSIVRQQLIQQRIAEAEDLGEPLSEEALRARYEQVREDSAQVEFGFITVPDQRTADQVVTALQARPGRFAEFAQRFAGPNTQPVQPVPAAEIPGPLAEQVAAAAPGTAFAVPVEQAGGVVVGLVGERVYPEFEELRPQLEQEAATEVRAAAAALVEEVRADLDVEVNPRYGTLENGTVQPLGDGVVEILSAEG